MTDKIEKFGSRWWGMLVLSCIPIFIVLLPVLSGQYNFVDGESDRFQQDFYFYKDAILKGDSFFWNPYLLSGFPKFTSLTGGYFNPLVYLGLRFFSVPFVYNWLNFLYLAFASFFMALFLKKLSVNIWGCLTGGWIFVFGYWAYVHDITINIVLPLLPLLFILIWEIRKNKGAKNFLFILAGSLAIGLVWLSSFWHFLIEVLITAGLFSLFLVFVDWRQYKKSLKEYVKIPASYLAMVLGGTAIGLMQLIPTVIMMSLSVRTEQFTHWEAARGGIHPHDFISLILPYFNYPFLGRSSELMGYWGILSLFFIVVGFGFKKSKFELRPFFSALFLFSILLSADGSPLFYVFHHLPVINFLHAPGRWMIITFFSLAGLAAFGADAVLEEFEKIRNSRKLSGVLKVLKWISVLILFVSFLSTLSYFFKNKVLSVLNNYFDKFVYDTTSRLPLDYYHNYIGRLLSDLISSLNFSNPKFLLPFLFLIGSYFFLKFYREGKFSEPRKFISSAAVIIALNFIFVYAINDNFYKDYKLDKEPETVKFLNNKEEGRVFSFFRYMAPIKLQNYGAYGTKQKEAELRSELLFPNKNLPFKIESIDLEGDPMANKSMSHLITLLGAAASFPSAETLENMPIHIEEKIKIFESREPILSFLGVRYLLSPIDINSRIFPKIFETEVTDKNIKVFVYKNTDGRPLYYFTDESWLIEDVQPEELNRKFKELSAKITQEGLYLIEKKNNQLILKTNIEKSKLLVLSQNNLPGWKAYVDNKQTVIYNVGNVYMGVIVPQGEHLISFEYSYWSIWSHFLDNFLK